MATPLLQPILANGQSLQNPAEASRAAIVTAYHLACDLMTQYGLMFVGQNRWGLQVQPQSPSCWRLQIPNANPAGGDRTLAPLHRSQQRGGSPRHDPARDRPRPRRAEARARRRLGKPSAWRSVPGPNAASARRSTCPKAAIERPARDAKSSSSATAGPKHVTRHLLPSLRQGSRNADVVCVEMTGTRYRKRTNAIQLQKRLTRN